jgi:hypothetical protein
MFNIFYIDYRNHLLSLINSYCFSFLHISEQGCRNDIKKKTSIMQASNDQCIVPPPLDVSSGSVHCNALTQSSTVSYAFSCHTIDTCGEEQDVESASALPPPHSHPWVHVFSKSSSTTSLRTQCAAAAVTHRNVLSPKVLHQRSRCAQKKKRKITNILHEDIIPSNHFKLSTKDIDSQIVVFDGGNLSAPPIKPPGGILLHLFL